MGNIIELDNGLKFVILNKIKYEDNKYLFVASVTEDMKFLFLKQLDSMGNVEPVTDGNLIITLTHITQEQMETKNK